MSGCYDPSTSILAGMDTSHLQEELARLQQAYLDISSGRLGESYSYTQGNGAKATTFNKANLGDLIVAIRLLQSQLGIVEQPRRGIGVRF